MLKGLSFTGCTITEDDYSDKWKKRSKEMRTLHAGCIKAEPKFFFPATDPLPGAWDG